MMDMAVAEHLMAEGMVATFKNAMRSTVASVNVITCEHEGRHYGLTATAFSSVSAEPPTVLICVNDKASASKHIKASRHFCVNVLDGHMESIALAFSGQLPPEQRFASAQWVDLPSGNRTIAHCAAFFDCRVSAMFQVGTHWLILGEVIECHGHAAAPLVYAAGCFGGFKAHALKA